MLLSGMGLLSCRNQDREVQSNDILFAVGDSTLTLHEVVGRIPVGLEPADSAMLFDQIVDTWLSSILLNKVAVENLPDLDRIERRVQAFRNRLITQEYLAQMRASQKNPVSADSVRRFYNMYRHDMLAEAPLVKGLFVKASVNAPGIDEMRALIFDGSESAVDEFEKKWATQTLQYEYFQNEWLDWEAVAQNIPYRFYDADAFLKANTNFETTNNGTLYLLHVAEWLPSQSELPFEFAEPRINSILQSAGVRTYEEDLVKHLIRKNIKDGTLKIEGYDPLHHKFLGWNNDKKTDKNNE